MNDSAPGAAATCPLGYSIRSRYGPSRGGDGARLKALAARLVNIAASFVAEALLVVFYLVFLLLEVGRFPARVRGGFRPEQADRVLAIMGSINNAMTSYLRAKVLSSVLTALP